MRVSRPSHPLVRWYPKSMWPLVTAENRKNPYLILPAYINALKLSHLWSNTWWNGRIHAVEETCAKLKLSKISIVRFKVIRHDSSLIWEQPLPKILSPNRENKRNIVCSVELGMSKRRINLKNSIKITPMNIRIHPWSWETTGISHRARTQHA